MDDETVKKYLKKKSSSNLDKLSQELKNLNNDTDVICAKDIFVALLEKEKNIFFKCSETEIMQRCVKLVKQARKELQDER